MVWRLDRWGRSVTDLLATLQELEHLGVGFVSLTEALDRTTPAGRAMAGLLAVFAEFEREMIRERTLSGIRAAQAAGKVVGRPKRVFRRDEVVRLRDEEGLSWRAIGKKLGIPAMTALDSYRQPATAACTETVVPEAPVSSGKRRKKIAAA